MKNFLVNKYGRQVTAGEVKELFGLERKDPWPAEGMEKRTIQGFICWVDPLGERKELARWPHKSRVQFRLRARYYCGVCGDETPIGRGEQHSKKHKA